MLLGSGLWVELRVNVQAYGYCLGLGLALRFRRELRSGHVRVNGVRPKETISFCTNRYLNKVDEQWLEREVERFANWLRR